MDDEDPSGVRYPLEHEDDQVEEGIREVLAEEIDTSNIFIVEDDLETFDCVEYTENLEENHAKVVVLFGNDLLTLLATYGVSSWLPSVPPGTKLRPRAAKETTLREVYHYGLCDIAARAIRQAGFNVTNLEDRTYKQAHHTMAELKEIAPRWNITHMRPDIVVFNTDSSDAAVIEVTGGDKILAYQKLEKYLVDDSEGRLAVLCRQLKTGETECYTGIRSDFLESVLKVLKEDMVGRQLTLWANAIVSIATQHDVALRAIVEQAQPVNLMKITAGRDSISNLLWAMPAETFPETRKIYLNEESARMHTSREVEQNLRKTYLTLRKEYYKYQQYFETAEGTISYQVMNLKKLEKMWDAGKYVEEKFHHAGETDPPEIGIFLRPNKDTFWREKTIMSVIDDPRSIKKIVKGRLKEDETTERAMRVMKGHLFPEGIPEDEYLEEIMTLIEEKDFMSIDIGKKCPKIKKALGMGAKAEKKMKAYISHGSTPKEMEYRSHDPEDGLRFMDDAITYARAVDDDGVDYPVDWKETNNFDCIKEKNKMVNCINMVREEWSAAMNPLCEIHDIEYYLKRTAMQIVTAYNNTGYEKVSLIVHDGEVKLRRGFGTYVEVPGDFPGLQLLDHFDPITYRRADGRDIYMENVSNGLSIVRPPPGMKGRTPNKRTRYLRLYRRKVVGPKTLETVNYSGHLLAKWEMSNNEEVCLVLMEKYGYQLAAAKGGQGRMATYLGAFSEMRTKFQKVGDELNYNVGQFSILEMMRTKLKLEAEEFEWMLKKTYFSTIIKSLNSSLENEAINIINSVLGPSRDIIQKSTLGDGLVELLVSNTINWGSREESEWWAEKLTKAGIIKATDYTEDSEIHKTIVEQHHFNDTKEELYNDPSGWYTKFFNKHGFGSPAEERENIEEVKVVYRRIAKDNPPPLYSTAHPKERIEVKGGPLERERKPEFTPAKVFNCTYTDVHGKVQTKDRIGYFVRT